MQKTDSLLQLSAKNQFLRLQLYEKNGFRLYNRAKKGSFTAYLWKMDLGCVRFLVDFFIKSGFSLIRYITGWFLVGCFLWVQKMVFVIF